MRSARRRWLLAAGIPLGAAAAIVSGAVLTTHAAPEAGPVATAQPFDLPPVVPGGAPAALPARPDAATVVTFFAAWCAPCRAELPLLEATARRPRAPRLVGIDVMDQRPDAEDLLRQAGVTFPSGFDRDGSASARWGVDGLPVTVFVRPGGRIVAYHRGELRQGQLDHLLARLDS